MKIYVTTPPAIPIAAWLRRYATELIVITLVLLATLGVGVAQALYSNVAPQPTSLAASLKTNVALDQHERHPTTR